MLKIGSLKNDVTGKIIEINTFWKENDSDNNLGKKEWKEKYEERNMKKTLKIVKTKISSIYIVVDRIMQPRFHNYK